MDDGERPGIELPTAGLPAERRDAAANRRRIIEAALRLIATGGPDGFSMDSLAAAAGVGKGTIFRRFGDRSGLIDALVDEYMRDFQDAFLSGPPPLGPGAPPGERLEAFLVALVTLHVENLSVAVTAGGVPSAQAREGAFWPLHLHARTLIRRLDPDLDADIVASLLLSLTAPLNLELLLRVQGATVDQVVSSLRAVLHGIAPTLR